MSTAETLDWAEKIGKSAFDAIAEMVAAGEVDYNRLEELRGERDAWGESENTTWADANEEDAKELAKLEEDAGDCEGEYDAQSRIEEDPLSIEVGGWWTLESEPEPSEYRILLVTGGPAVRIVGALGRHNKPSSASLEVQDWAKPWTEYPCDQEVLLSYVSRIYMGD